jgi:hypothetical protein
MLFLETACRVTGDPGLGRYCFRACRVVAFHHGSKAELEGASAEWLGFGAGFRGANSKRIAERVNLKDWREWERYEHSECLIGQTPGNDAGQGIPGQCEGRAVCNGSRDAANE